MNMGTIVAVSFNWNVTYSGKVGSVYRSVVRDSNSVRKVVRDWGGFMKLKICDPCWHNQSYVAFVNSEK